MLAEVNDTTVQHEGFHAHWDCFSGAAGDMMLAACFDAIDFNLNENNNSNRSMIESTKLLQRIEESIQHGLPDLSGEFTIDCKRVWRGSGSITALHVTVNSVYKDKPVAVPPPPTPSTVPYECTTLEDTSPSHDVCNHHSHTHDHHHHSHEHNHIHETCVGSHSVANNHTHEHSHDHSSIESGDRIRNLPEIRRMLMQASDEFIPDWVRIHAIAAFTELAKAEASVHGATSIEDVHFHEVGAIDSIVDTVGTLLALYYLNVTSVSCSRLPLGEGMVSTAHGILPVPAPATLHLMSGMPLTSGPPGRTGELVTPTAAALLRVLVGIGAGTKDFTNHPNIIRLLIGDCSDEQGIRKSTNQVPA
jgi:pyridinium-3,5-bisthiocarboxylic acid mononucleotide nickel chelatase